MYCPNCHHEVSETQAFCENCGTRLATAQGRTQPIGDIAGNTAEMPPIDAYQQSVEVVAEPIPGTGNEGTGSYYQQPVNNEGSQQPYGYTAPQGTGGQPYGYNAGPTPPGGGYSAPGMQQPVSNVPFGLSIGALVCTLFGLIPVAIVLAIIALVMNSNQKKSGVVSTKQTPTFVMSVISLVLSVLITIALFFLGFAVVSVMEEEGVNFDVDSSGAVTVTTPSSSSASTSAGNAHSSSSASSSSASASSASAAATDGTLSSGASTANGYVGTWTITAIESASLNSSNSNINIDPVALLEDLGLNMAMTLNEDGTLSFEVMDETLPGTWTETATGISVKIENKPNLIVFDNNAADFVAEGDTLVLADGDDRIVFSRQ